MTTMNVLDSGGATVAVEKPLAPGRTAAATSRPVALSTEDLAAVNQLHTDLVAPTPAGTNVIGHVIVDSGSVAISNVNGNGRAVPASSAPVVLNSMTSQTVAASTTQQCGATGLSGDYLDGVLIIPGTIAAGVVQVKDGSGTAFTIFVGGGTTPLTSCIPFYVPWGAISSGGAGGWKVITNANVTAVAIGNFT